MHGIDVFEALADPTRRGVVESLRHGERTVGSIVTQLDIDQSGVSRHLRILSDAGIVRCRRDGSRRFYSLTPRPFRELERWMARYKVEWDARLDRLATQLRDRGPNPSEGRKEPP